MLTEEELLGLFPIIKAIEAGDKAKTQELMLEIKNPILSKIFVLQEAMNSFNQTAITDALAQFNPNEAHTALEFFITHITKKTEEVRRAFSKKWEIMEQLFNLLETNGPEMMYQILSLNVKNEREGFASKIIEKLNPDLSEFVFGTAASHSDVELIKFFLRMNFNKPSQQAINSAFALLIQSRAPLISLFDNYTGDLFPKNWAFVQNLLTTQGLIFDQDTLKFIGCRAAEHLNLSTIQLLCNPQSTNKPDSAGVSRMLERMAYPRDSIMLGWKNEQAEIIRLLIGMKGASAPSSESLGKICDFLIQKEQLALITTLWDIAENKPDNNTLKNALDIYISNPFNSKRDWDLLLYICNKLKGYQLAQPVINTVLMTAINSAKYSIAKQLLEIKEENPFNRETTSALLKKLTDKPYRQEINLIPWDLVEILLNMEGQNQPDKDSIQFALNRAAQQFNYPKLVALCQLKAVEAHTDMVAPFLEQQREKHERLQPAQVEAQQRVETEAQQQRAQAEAQQRAEAEARQRAEEAAQQRTEEEARQRAQAAARQGPQAETQSGVLINNRVSEATAETIDTITISTNPIEEIDVDYAEKLCNQFLSINGENKPMNIRVVNDANQIIINQEFFGLVLKEYLPEINKLKHILEKLGLDNIQAVNPSPMERQLRVPKSEMSKLTSYCLDQNKIEEKSQLEKIKILCAQYLAHTWQVRQKSAHPYSEELLNSKEQAVAALYHAEHLEDARSIFQKQVAILNKDRNPKLLLIVQAIAILLTFPISLPALAIYSKVTRGSFAFFKPTSKLLAENISTELLPPAL